MDHVEFGHGGREIRMHKRQAAASADTPPARQEVADEAARANRRGGGPPGNISEGQFFEILRMLPADGLTR
jgi:hypothetical protein